jgi:hypothetical protein
LQESWSDQYNFKKKKMKKGTPPMVWDCWQAPEDSVSHGLWKERWGGVPNFYKITCKCLFSILGTALNLFSMEDNKDPVAIR